MTGAQSLAWFNLLPLWRRRVRVWQHELRGVSLDRLAYLYLHQLGWMGGEEKRFLEQHVRAGMRVLDIGANLGLYTLLLSRLVGETGSVISLEPDPDLFEALRANCQSNGARNVELHNLAAGSRPGRMTLSRSLANAGDNRLTPRRGPGLTRMVDVQVATVDELAAGHPVHFIKMDVQGWEGEVFRGMQRVLDENPDLQILFEYWPYGLRNAGYDPLGLLSELKTRGFGIYGIAGNVSAPITDRAKWKAPTGKRFTNLYATREGRV